MKNRSFITSDMNPIHLLVRIKTGWRWPSEPVYLVDETEKKLVTENGDELTVR